jgi:hypothetical protein
MMLALQGIPAAERGAVMGTVSMSIDLALGLGPATFGLVAAGLDRSTGFLTAALVATAGLLLATRTTPSRLAGRSARSRLPRTA